MHLTFAVVALALEVLYLLLLARIVVDLTRMFARAWRPAGITAIGLEFIYTTTDPPIRALRRVIPPLRFGGISLDLSVWLLLIAIVILRQVALGLAY